MSEWQGRFRQAIISYLVENGGLVLTSGGSRYGSWQDFGPAMGWDHTCGSTGGTTRCSSREKTCPYCRAPRPDPADHPSEHIKTCGINFARSSYEDSEWSEFAGTFAEDPWPISHGIDAVVTCQCGKVAGRHWRYTGTHAELLNGIAG